VTARSASSRAARCHHHDPALTHAPCTNTVLTLVSLDGRKPLGANSTYRPFCDKERRSLATTDRVAPLEDGTASFGRPGPDAAAFASIPVCSWVSTPRATQRRRARTEPLRQVGGKGLEPPTSAV
jgi:hypothetical protein